ncbi:MAG TPA: type II toxin-antitoxin system RelE/ParE family toxin [Gemmataceae bacterium]|nr:type II toxin-antitoxin system RelE/ParE family toxin [Gemmataceae bacterium]
MNLPLTVRRAARLEYDLAVDWYEQRRPGLGADFIRRIKDQLDGIVAAPLAHAIVHRDIRRAVVEQFPYVVYYRVLTTKIVVTAVFHSSRDPRIWQSRS